MRLAGSGFTVFATVRKEKDAENLKNLNLERLIPVWPLDLSNPEQIHDAQKVVAELSEARGIKGLYALINNAGGGSPAPVELMELNKFRQELLVRVLGSVSMVQTCLPLIRQVRGRIIWIMTPALIPTPYVSMIHACDFSLNCIARTLDIELNPWKIKNIMIKCGGIKTSAGLRTAADIERLLENVHPSKKGLYEKTLQLWSQDMKDFDKKRSPPEKVAQAVYKALVCACPKRRYSIGYMSKTARILELIPQPVIDKILKMRF